MARSVRGGTLETRGARLRLAPRGKPYYVSGGQPGLHLGYRRIADRNGTWLVRSYAGDGKYSTEAFGTADDYADANAENISTYWQAFAHVQAMPPPKMRTGGAYTVGDAVRDYLAVQRRDKKSPESTARKLEIYVIPQLGNVPIGKLTSDALDRWVEWALAYRRHKAKPKSTRKRMRDSRAAAPSVAAPPLPPDELLRRRKATVGRVIAALKAALQHAYRRQKVARRDAWEHLRRFRGVETSRQQRLTTEEARRLINACPPDFRRLVEAALITGCRYGELCAIRARDFDAGSKKLHIPISKGGKARWIPLTDEGAKLLEELTAPLESGDFALQKADGTAWSTSEQSRRMAAACAAAKINPPVSFHALRHTFASLLVEAGTPLMVVATVLGHRDTRMVEAHYAHLAPSFVAQTIRANLPTFGVRTSGKVTRLRP